MATVTKTLKINKKEAVRIAAQILDSCDGLPLDKTSTVLNGMFVAMASIAANVKKYETHPGMTERMILSWFKTHDKTGTTEFGKYINLKEEEQ